MRLLEGNQLLFAWPIENGILFHSSENRETPKVPCIKGAKVGPDAIGESSYRNRAEGV
jgi:hypothetical protein